VKRTEELQTAAASMTRFSDSLYSSVCDVHDVDKAGAVLHALVVDRLYSLILYSSPYRRRIQKDPRHILSPIYSQLVLGNIDSYHKA